MSRVGSGRIGSRRVGSKCVKNLSGLNGSGQRFSNLTGRVGGHPDAAGPDPREMTRCVKSLEINDDCGLITRLGSANVTMHVRVR